MTRQEYLEKLRSLIFHDNKLPTRFIAADNESDILYQQRPHPTDVRTIIITAEQWRRDTPQQLFDCLPAIIEPQKEEQPS